ncbi:MAG: WcaF family extracellular polysaccharide biosynthesis acetyltransferase [Bacteroidia bacterium]
MEQLKTDLTKYNPGEFNRGASTSKFLLWQIAHFLFFVNPFFGFSGLRCKILRAFGAKIGKGVVMNKPHINIKFPWRLTIGDHSWLGERSWIYNLVQVEIGSHVNIAQGAFILTGNHNFKSVEFENIDKPIIIEDGVFIGANAVVCGGVTCKSHSVLAVGSVAVKDMEPYKIYQGNPAMFKKDREIAERKNPNAVFTKTH